MHNGRFVFGHKLPDELKWTNDETALVGALLLRLAVLDPNF